MIENYVLKRESLSCLFILIDARLPPQANDLDFIQWVGGKSIPMALLFTKIDKLKLNELQKNLKSYENKLLTQWEELPTMVLTSSVKKTGKEEILDIIDDAIKEGKEKK